jgi:predicted mannosyl-3-phosphoglycerate phosphatase (HAD superfamily)
MCSTQSYLKLFLEIDNTLKESLEKQPKSEVIKKILELSNKMFYFTTDKINKLDMLEIENRLLYEKLQQTQIELETLKLNYDRKISENSK